MAYLGDTWWGRILSNCDTEPTELLMGGFLKWLVGTWLFLPFQSFKASPTFASLGEIVPENIWAVLLMALGATHMLALRSGNVRYRRWAAFMGMVIWAGMGFSFIVLNPPAFGAMLFLTAAICQGWCCIRLRG